jgi:hypothetical protein
MDVEILKDSKLVPIDDCAPNPWNPHKTDRDKLVSRLKTSFLEFGFIGAILVRPHPDKTGGPKYQIIDGEHRWIALKEAGAKTIPVIVKELSDDEAPTATLDFNITQGTMDGLDVAKLVVQVVDRRGEDYVRQILDFTAAELASFRDLAEFDFEKFERPTGSRGRAVEDETEQWFERTFMFTAGMWKTVKDALVKAKAEGGVKHDGHALELICADYLAGPGVNGNGTSVEDEGRT